MAGLDTLDGEPELPVRKLLHRVQDGGCLAELPGFNIAQLRLSYRELEQLAAKKAGRCKSCKKLKFPSCILADSCYNSKAIVSKAARRGSRY